MGICIGMHVCMQFHAHVYMYVCVPVYVCMYEFMNMYSHACVPMWAYALLCMCVCNCMCLSILVVFLFLLQVYMPMLANAEVIGKCGHVCAQEYICIYMYVCVYMHIYMSMCISLDVCVFCIGYSHYHMPTDSAVDTHININLSTMTHIVATNYAGALCIVPARNTHTILLI